MQVTEEVWRAWKLKVIVYFLLRIYILTRHQKKHVLNIVFFHLELINERQYIQQYDILRGISHGINDWYNPRTKFYPNNLHFVTLLIWWLFTRVFMHVKGQTEALDRNTKSYNLFRKLWCFVDLVRVEELNMSSVSFFRAFTTENFCIKTKFQPRL